MAKFLYQGSPGALSLNKNCPLCGNKYLYRVKFKAHNVYVHPYKVVCKEPKNEISA